MKPTFVIYASSGNGHRAAAEAVSEALGDMGKESVTADILQFADRIFRSVYSDGYHLAGEHSRPFCRAMYRITDRDRSESRIVQLIDRLSADRVARFSRFLGENSPDCVVATHFLPMYAVARQKARGLYKGELHVVVTDLDLHRMWVCDHVNRYHVPTDDAARKLRMMGVPKLCTKVTGIPVKRAFCIEPERDPENGGPLNVLLLGSSIPDGKVLQAVSGILHRLKRVRLTVIAGRNPGLFEILGRQKPETGADQNLMVLPFVRDVAPLFASSDLLITKPGGLTTAEAACCSLPMLLVDPIPCQETKNAEILQNAGAGEWVKNFRDLPEKVLELDLDRGRLLRMQEACRGIARPDAARTVARDIVSVKNLAAEETAPLNAGVKS
ncbi:MAG: MGDG synthase family glycosyltransferase [Thermovirgaceae bacterium]